MKYLLSTLIIFSILLNGQFAQVRVESSTGNVTIGALTTSSHKLDLKGDLFISPQSSFPSSTIIFGNESGVELGIVEFNDYTNSTNLNLKSNFGHIRINAEEEIQFLTNSGSRAVMKTDGMFFRDSKYLGWEENGIRKAYLQYNGQDMFLENDEVNGDITLDAGGKIWFSINDTERMILSEFGHLGLGLSQPGEKLTIHNGNISLSAGYRYGFKENNIWKAGMAYNGTDMYIINEEGSGILSLSSERYVSLSTNAVEHFRLSLNGNIGIGQTAPTEKLHVNGGIRLGNAIDNANGTIRYSGTDLEGRVGNSWVSLTAAGGGGGGLWSNTGSSAYYTTGNVGIGTNAPAHELQVNCDIGMTGEIIGVSDMRTKKDILDIQEAVDKLHDLRPVTYNFDQSNFENLELPEGIQYGFIAQEVMPVFPELVSISSIAEDKEGKAQNLQGINYIQLIPILTQAIKDQYSQVNNQNERLNQQQHLLDTQSLLIAELQKELKLLKGRNQ
jgi:hypothetical protein